MRFQSRGIQKAFTEDELLEIKDLLREDDFDINGTHFFFNRLSLVLCL